MDFYQSLFAGLMSANNSIRKNAENELENSISKSGIFSFLIVTIFRFYIWYFAIHKSR